MKNGKSKRKIEGRVPARAIENGMENGKSKMEKKNGKWKMANED